MDSGQSAPGRSAAERVGDLRAKNRGLQASADNDAIGPDGGVSVARVLADLASEFVVLHDLSIPGSNANIDHLVIGPTGVFMVEARCWTRRLTAAADTRWRASKPVHDECATAVWLAQQLSDVIGRPVRPIIGFVDTALPAAVQQCNGVTVCESDALLSLLRDGTRGIEPNSVAAVAFVARPLVRADGFQALSAATARRAEAVAQAQAQAQAKTQTQTQTQTDGTDAHDSADHGPPCKRPRRPTHADRASSASVTRSATTSAWRPRRTGPSR